MNFHLSQYKFEYSRYICDIFEILIRNNHIKTRFSVGMKSKVQMRKVVTFLGIIFFLSDIAFAEERTSERLPEKKINTTSLFSRKRGELSNNYSWGVDSLSFSRYYIHKVGIDVRPGFIIPTHDFLRGDNEAEREIRSSFSAHLKYSFQFYPNSYTDRIYGGVYQGLGLAYYSFGERKQLGNPMAFYLFQGARIAQFSSRLSFNYEWNFGLSVGWHPYDYEYNSFNKVIGSKINAYLNTNFYLNCVLSPLFDFNTGITLTHFSNGNTRFPNAGLNMVGWKVGLVYNFNRKNDFLSKPLYQSLIPKFPRHISYDVVLFGSWRKKGIVFGDKQVASPDIYPVLGFSFAPMYNIGYKFRAGLSLDGVYDGSANVYTEDYIVGTTQEFLKPPVNKQLALGVSGRAEYVMPYFSVNFGLGVNVLHGGGDLKSFYQVLALKIEVTRSSFIHIGYNLQNFHTPNFLMLGIGFRFNNKYPTFHR